MKKEPLPKTIENTLILFIVTVVFLLIIATYERSTIAPEVRHAMEASHGEEPKPQEHGR